MTTLLMTRLLTKTQICSMVFFSTLFLIKLFIYLKQLYYITYICSSLLSYLLVALAIVVSDIFGYIKIRRNYISVKQINKINFPFITNFSVKNIISLSWRTGVIYKYNVFDFRVQQSILVLVCRIAFVTKIFFNCLCKDIKKIFQVLKSYH